jgi:hypothetical protein
MLITLFLYWLDNDFKLYNSLKDFLNEKVFLQSNILHWHVSLKHYIKITRSIKNACNSKDTCQFNRLDCAKLLQFNLKEKFYPS